jgi:hypothetical protein
MLFFLFPWEHIIMRSTSPEAGSDGSVQQPHLSYPSSFEFLATNVSGRIRVDKLAGRDHLVVPLSMLVPGVLNGSRGPLLYPQSEVSRDPSSWNGMPIVVDHPVDNDGHPCSARSPDVLEKCGIGTVYNTGFSRGKLRAEGWIDMERARTLCPKQFSLIKSGKPAELSTGLFTDNVPVKNKEAAVHNGVPFTHVARNHRPDHLAILTGTVGACSVKDGCGVNVYNEHSTSADDVSGDKEQDGTSNAAASTDQLSADDKRKALQEMIRGDGIGDYPGISSGPSAVESSPRPYVSDLFDDYFIYEMGGKTYRQGYSMVDGSPVVDNKDPEEVIKVTSYRPLANGDGFLTPNAFCPTGLDGEIANNAATTTTKKEGSETLKADSYAYVPDPDKPFTWKLRIDDAQHVGAAIAALGAGFRGQKVDIPAADRASVKKKVKAAWLKFHPDKGEEDLPKVLCNGWQLFTIDQKEDEGMPKTKNLTKELREQIVNDLIANTGVKIDSEAPWVEEDREGLLTLSDGKLVALNAQREALASAMCSDDECDDDDDPDKAEKESATGNSNREVKVLDKGRKQRKERPAVNASPERDGDRKKAKTADEWLADAPDEVRSAVNNAMAFERQQKDGLIKRITDNDHNTFSKAYLESRSLDELRGLAALAINDDGNQDGPMQVLMPSYAGVPGIVQNINPDFQSEDQDMVPEPFDWGTPSRK